LDELLEFLFLSYFLYFNHPIQILNMLQRYKVLGS
jgi:hypothetical protein